MSMRFSIQIITRISISRNVSIASSNWRPSFIKLKSNCCCWCCSWCNIWWKRVWHDRSCINYTIMIMYLLVIVVALVVIMWLMIASCYWRPWFNNIWSFISTDLQSCIIMSMWLSIQIIAWITISWNVSIASGYRWPLD